MEIRGLLPEQKRRRTGQSGPPGHGNPSLGPPPANLRGNEGEYRQDQQRSPRLDWPASPPNRCPDSDRADHRLRRQPRRKRQANQVRYDDATPPEKHGPQDYEAARPISPTGSSGESTFALESYRSGEGMLPSNKFAREPLAHSPPGALNASQLGPQNAGRSAPATSTDGIIVSSTRDRDTSTNSKGQCHSDVRKIQIASSLLRVGSGALWATIAKF